MHIIGINPKSEYLNPKQFLNPNSPMLQTPKFGIWNLGHWDLFRISDFGFRIFAVLIAGLLFLGFLSGCVQKSDLEQAQGYARQSQEYYQRAVREFQSLIKKGKDLDKLYFALGQLYFEQGDFQQAQEVLQKTSIVGAKKLLAIAYYRLGKFSDALEIFDKYKISDDEYLYYRGLTCEKLNLFDQALEIYKKINDPRFTSKAREQIERIEKQASARHIQAIDAAVSQILEAAPPQEKYPQAGALILHCDEKIEITAQNTQVASLHYIVKILNERGKEDFSETNIDYDSTYEKVELEYARTIKPDGAVAEVGARHIRDVSKYLNFPLYSNARAFIISFPEIAEGACIEYKAKVYRNQLINKKDFVLGYPLETSEPIIAASFSVDLPKNKQLYIKTLNDKYNDFGASLKPNIQQNNERIVYTWQFKNIPQIIPESNMPPQIEINPTILLSTFKNWQEIYDWWWQLAKDKIKADTAIKEKVIELTRNVNSEEAKVRAIYNFCAQNIRYVAIEYGQAGYEPHKAEDIFKNKYGDCKDQAILLVTMLKEAGFRAFPVLIATEDYYNLNENFPSVLFNHCIAAVSLKDKIIFLDPTAETCSFGDLPVDDQERKVLIFKDDGFKIEDTPLYPAPHNLVEQYSKIKLNNDETITAGKSIFTQGIYDRAQRYWLLYTLPELIEETLKEKIQDISIGAKLDRYEIRNLKDLNTPVVLSYSFSGPEYFTNAGILRIMPQLASLDTSVVAKDKRKFPLYFGALDTQDIVLEFELPPNFVVKYMPEGFSEDSLWLKFLIEYNQKGNMIYFRQKQEWKKNRVQVTEYPDFKIFFEALAKRIKQRIVLEKPR